MSDLKADTVIACLFVGDARETITRLPSRSVQCCVTSPPYYGLRDYQVDGQIGLEETPDEYVSTIVDVFRNVRRVLRDDGTVWLNLGDSYASLGGVGQQRHWDGRDKNTETQSFRREPYGIVKSKDLIGIPWRVAFAMQADGWYLRSAIVWHKPNPMPESVTDRPTSSYEMVFLLTKSDRYFYDADAVKEEGTIPAGTLGAKGSAERAGTKGVNSRPAEYAVYTGTRNLRNVWSISPTPFPGAHFATMPVELAARCILAGTSERGCCAKCGAPWARIVERDSSQLQHAWSGAGRANGCIAGGGHMGRTGQWETNTSTIGWQPTCQCDAPTQPCTVLDPFGGSGTTALAAMQNNRDSWLIDLKPDYVDELSKQRLKYAALPITVQELGDILRYRRTLQRLCARNDMSEVRMYARGPVQLTITELLMPRQPQLKITELFGNA